MSFHKDEVGSSLHNLQAFTYADAASRLAGAGLVSADIGKVAKQTDTNRYYILLSDSPVTWSEITAPSNGGSGVNYIINTNSEDSTAGWATYADAAAAVPVNGTGGSPNVTFTRSTSSPLRGAASFLLTKDAANRQGQGASYDFTIDRADLAQPISIEFDYEPSTNFVAGDSSDLRVYIYDVTNSLVIQPAPYTIQGGIGEFTFKSIFQTASNSTSYRLILHVATTNALAWTFKCDSFRIGPQAVLLGAPVSDWNSFVPTGSWSTNTTYTGEWRRVGDSADVRVKVATSGAPTAATLTVQLPTGLVIDTAKLTTGTYIQLGDGVISDSDTTIYDGPISINDTTSVAPKVDAGSTITLINATTPFTFGAGDYLTLRFTVPIVGWGSSVVMSNDTDTRVTAARYFMSASSATATLANNTANPVVLDFDSKVNDTHSAVTPGASWKYTAPVPGFYKVIAHAQDDSSITAAAVNRIFNLSLHINGSNAKNADLGTPHRWQTTAAAIGAITGGEATVFLNAGDYFDVRGFQNSGTALTYIQQAQGTYISVERISGPSTVAASETVAMRYTTTAGQNVTHNVFVALTFGTKDYDTHGAFDGTTFIAPAPGKYHLSAAVAVDGSGGGTWAVGDYLQLRVRINGVDHSYSTLVTQASNSQTIALTIVADMKLNAGDAVQFQLDPHNSTVGTSNMLTNVGFNYLCIHKIGM